MSARRRQSISNPKLDRKSNPRIGRLMFAKINENSYELKSKFIFREVEPNDSIRDPFAATNDKGDELLVRQDELEAGQRET